MPDVRGVPELSDGPDGPDRSVVSRLSRELWRVMEPFHQLAYRSPEAMAAAAAIGVTRADHVYFGHRVAALGPVGPTVATAVLYGFAPQYVARAIPELWIVAPAAALVAARQEGAVATLTRVLGAETMEGAAMTKAATVAQALVHALDFAGRPLAAAHAETPRPDVATSPAGALWHACTVWREHRGDAHWAATSGAGIDGVECHVLHAADGAMPAELLQRVSGCTDEAWVAAADRLATRGLLDAAGQLTEQGRHTKLRIEWATDGAAAQSITAVGVQAVERLRALMAPWVATIVASGVVGAWKLREELWRDLPDPSTPG
jgi:hypothetical protein